MSHKKTHKAHGEPSLHAHHLEPGAREAPGLRHLEIVVKCDTRGTLDAVLAALSKIAVDEIEIDVIERGVGDVSKADLSMALTGSHLVLGFDVGAMPKVDDFAREHGVEIRLYNVIYHLIRDVEEICRSLVVREEEERILAQARVIALFKSTRKGIILGCEVLQGRIALRMSFRVIAAAGPIHTGVVESLKIEQNFVNEARLHQQFGLKIHDFKNAQIGDLVECFETVRPTQKPWSPRPGVHRVNA
jgi:translation initiation factor IF-2